MPELINPDVKLIFDAIKAKRPRYTLMYHYYEGLHPLRYSTERLKKAFEKIDTYFSINWIGVIIESVTDRLILKGFDISDNDSADDVIDELFKQYDLQLVADDVHEAAEVTGEAFVIALQSEDADNENPLDIYFNDPRMCHVIYDFNRPNKKRVAGKIYLDELRYVCMVLYYDDRFEYYKSNRQLKAKEEFITSSEVFRPDEDQPIEDNPFGIVPVFHFRTNRVSRKRPIGPSEISLQDAENKLLTDMLVSSEFNAFVQRVIISQADPGDLQNIAGANWWLPSGDGKGQQTSVQELGGRMLTGFLEAMDKLASALAIISRTPKHYFFAQGGDPSGEALIAMEAPLTKKTSKRQRGYSTEWQKLCLFLLELSGVKDVKRNQIVPTWEPVSTIQPLTSAQIVQTETSAGVPLKTSVRRQGWTNEEMKQMEADKKEEDKSKTSLAQDALNKLRAEDAANNDTSRIAQVNSQNNGGTNTRVPAENRS